MSTPFEYHIHVDGQAPIVEPHRSWFAAQGFLADQFVPLDKDAGFEPHDHLSVETPDRSIYEPLLATTMAYLRAHPDAVNGYVESEAIVGSTPFECAGFNPDVPLPIELIIQPVAEFLIDVPPNWFRQSEIHFSSRRDQTDERLINALRRIGLYTAHYRSSVDGELYIIFTVQGYQREMVQLEILLKNYLQKAGGHCNGKLQLEVVTDYWKSSPDVPLPPIVNPASFSRK